jgi:hypothetical protein
METVTTSVPSLIYLDQQGRARIQGTRFKVIHIARDTRNSLDVDAIHGFKIVMGGSGEKHNLGKTYGVQAYPSNYLVDGNGGGVWRSSGFNEEALREALARLGLK